MEFTFEPWISEVGLSTGGLKCVQKAELIDLKALLLVDISDLDELSLSIGDRGKLKWACEQLRLENIGLFPRRASKVLIHDVQEKADIFQSPKQRVKPAVSPSDQRYSVEEVTGLLESQRISFQNRDTSAECAALQRDSTGRPPAFLGPARATTRSLGHGDALSGRARNYTQPLVSDLLAINDSSIDHIKGEKPYLPINFVSYLRGQHPDEESIIQTANGIDLVLRDNLKKTTPEKLTYGQYLEASHRIFRLLAPALTQTEFEEYLEYMSEVGILLQIFTTSSVFSLDHLHRQDMYYKGRRWDNINHTLQFKAYKCFT
jgi:hypothetical protein